MMLIGINPRWWDWVVALIFCGYIGYDWVEAQNKYKTLDLNTNFKELRKQLNIIVNNYFKLGQNIK